MLDDMLAKKYQVMSQLKPAPSVTVGGDLQGKAAPVFGKGGLFGDVPVGGSGTFGSFVGRNAGPGLPTVIAGAGSPFGMIDTYRTQGFTPEQAIAATIGGAGAQKDLVNASLRPAESAADIEAQRAGAFLNREQGAVVRPVADANIAATRAGVAQTGAQTSLIGQQIIDAKRKNKQRLPEVDYSGYGALSSYLTPQFGLGFLDR